MGYGCSLSGGWILKALEHEYIDKRVWLVVTLLCRELGGWKSQEGWCSFRGCTVGEWKTWADGGSWLLGDVFSLSVMRLVCF